MTRRVGGLGTANRKAERGARPPSKLNWKKLEPALALVRECRELYGKSAARRLWCMLPLPPPATFEIRGTRAQKPNRETVALFTADRIENDPRSEAQAQNLYEAYAVWCDQHGRHAETLTAFGRELAALGFRKLMRRGCVFYCDLRIKPARSRRPAAKSPAPPSLDRPQPPNSPKRTRRVGRVHEDAGKPSGVVSG